MAGFITSNFLPVEAHIKEKPAWFHRFDVSWTPTVLLMDAEGVEKFRIEGYLPKPEFRAALELGLARLAFKKKHWPEAQERYAGVAQRYPDSFAAPEALYWTGVSEYQHSHDPKVLSRTAAGLREKFPHNLWTSKASVWLP